MKTRLKATLLLLCSLTLFLGLFVPATAEVIVPSPPHPPLPLVILSFLDIKYHHVDVTIDNQVAITRVDQVFLNSSDQVLEGTYLFPLPEDAAISSFSMWADGEKLGGKILDKDEARRIYESIVYQRRDPALLEYIGQRAFQASVYPIPAHGEKRIQLEYSQVLQQDSGLVRYIYPLSTEKFSPRPIAEVVINVSIVSRVAIKAVYSPSHSIATSRPDDWTAVVSYEENDVRPDRDFELYYTVSAEDFGLNLLTYREGGDAGFFLLLLAPKIAVAEQEVVAKDIVFVVDTSGSMGGQKLEQAKSALEFIINSLNEDDRFNIITFNTVIRHYATDLRPSSEREEAIEFVRSLTAAGSTNINEALLAALEPVQGERPYIVIFLTDGLPTVGITDAQAIIDNVNDVAGDMVRLFAFGVGDDVNTILLDTIAQQNGGASEYVRPGQDLESRVSAFYEKIGTPVLTDVELDFGGIRVEDIYPRRLPDLFAGSQLILLSRYLDQGAATITLSGKINGEERVFSYDDNLFPGENRDNSFIPRLWATRKVGYLLDQIRLHGSDKELVDEIVALSTRYGIMTPYTSFLVEEKEAPPMPPPKPVPGPILMPTSPSGSAAVETSQTLKALRESEIGGGAPSQLVKAAGDKVFVLRDSFWVDTIYETGKPTVKVGFGSDYYFRLLRDHPQWGKYFAAGESVIVVLDGRAYEITAGDFPPPPSPEVTPSPPPSPHPPEVTPADNLLAQIWERLIRLWEILQALIR